MKRIIAKISKICLEMFKGERSVILDDLNHIVVIINIPEF